MQLCLSHMVLYIILRILYVQSGQTPLWLACFHGHQKCVELLLKAGASVDMPDEVSVIIKLVVCVDSAMVIIIDSPIQHLTL